MPAVFTKEGKRYNYSEQEIADAISKNRWFDLDATINVVDKEGNVDQMDFTADNVKRAYATGSRLETPKEEHKGWIKQEYGGTGGALAATGLGLLRGATFGFSDQILTGLGVSSKTLRDIKEERSGWSTLGELAGTLGPTLATGGLSGGATVAAVGGKLGTKAGTRLAMKSVAGKGLARKIAAGLGQYAPSGLLFKATLKAEKGLAKAIPQGLMRLHVPHSVLISPTGKGLTKAVAATMAYGAEGAAYGAGSYISESALHDKPLLSENIIGSMGAGAFWGGVLGGAPAILRQSFRLLKKPLRPVGKELWKLKENLEATRMLTNKVANTLMGKPGVYKAAKTVAGGVTKKGKATAEELAEYSAKLDDLADDTIKRMHEQALPDMDIEYAVDIAIQGNEKVISTAGDVTDSLLYSFNNMTDAYKGTAAQKEIAKLRKYAGRFIETAETGKSNVEIFKAGDKLKQRMEKIIIEINQDPTIEWAMAADVTKEYKKLAGYLGDHALFGKAGDIQREINIEWLRYAESKTLWNRVRDRVRYGKEVAPSVRPTTSKDYGLHEAGKDFIAKSDEVVERVVTDTDDLVEIYTSTANKKAVKEVTKTINKFRTNTTSELLDLAETVKGPFAPKTVNIDIIHTAAHDAVLNLSTIAAKFKGTSPAMLKRVDAIRAKISKYARDPKLFIERETVHPAMMGVAKETITEKELRGIFEGVGAIELNVQRFAETYPGKAVQKLKDILGDFGTEVRKEVNRSRVYKKLRKNEADVRKLIRENAEEFKKADPVVMKKYKAIQEDLSLLAKKLELLPEAGKKTEPQRLFSKVGAAETEQSFAHLRGAFTARLKQLKLLKKVYGKGYTRARKKAQKLGVLSPEELERFTKGTQKGMGVFEAETMRLNKLMQNIDKAEEIGVLRAPLLADEAERVRRTIGLGLGAGMMAVGSTMAASSGVGIGFAGAYIAMKGLRTVFSESGATEKLMQEGWKLIKKSADKIVKQISPPRIYMTPLLMMEVGEFYEVKDKLERIKEHPEKLQEHVTDKLGRMAHDSPELALQAVTAVQNTVDFLLDAAPSPPPSNNIDAIRGLRGKVSKREIAKFARKLHITEDPFVVLEMLEHGIIKKDDWDTMKTVYPRIAQQIQEQLTDALAHADKKPSYQTLMRLSLVLGQELHESLKPEYVARLQQTFMAPPPEAAGAAKAPKKKTAKKKAIKDMPNSEMTGMQGLSARRNA